MLTSPNEIVLAPNQFPGLTLAELEEFRGSVYSFYETVFGVRMIRAMVKNGIIQPLEPLHPEWQSCTS